MNGKHNNYSLRHIFNDNLSGVQEEKLETKGRRDAEREGLTEGWKGREF